MTIHLRQYQLDALAAEAEHRREHPDETRLAVVLPTGTGKTILFAERAVRYLESLEGAGSRVLILVHTDELAGQAEAKVRLVASGHDMPFTVGVVKAERDECTADIVIGSVQTLANPARRGRIRDVGLVIVDECHHATAASYRAILRHYGCFAEPDQPAVEPWASMVPSPHPAANCGPLMFALPVGHMCPTCGTTPQPVPALGFTATLERGDGQGLGDIWQDVAYSRDVSWAVRKGYLVQPIGHRLEIGMPALAHDGSGVRDIPPTLLDDFLINGLAPEKIVEKWIELAKDRPTAAFMPLVRSAHALADAFGQQGIQAAVIHGDMPTSTRRLMLGLYEAGDVQVLVNAMVLTEGWDSPRTSCVIVGRPTKSRSLFVQMAGRGLRPMPGIPAEEQDCILITVADATTDLCSIADLSDRPLDRKAQGALTVMEDQWDIGKELSDPTRLWTGQVDAREFDPLVRRSSKVWRTTEHGTPFLPISKDREYVFVVGTSVFILETWSRVSFTGKRSRRLHKDLPDLELALSLAEEEAEDRGGGLGLLLADKERPWRKQVPSAEMQSRAQQLGLGKELLAIMESRAGGKAGKLSDLIAAVIATRALEPMVEKIKEATRA